ncbi:C80 family cysteine peptidase [Candidatus Fukatsuia symbiotica]|nr:C80 family cysteine peptidase [Candidatus Fukatsuia symbiotica]MEA9445043.1 C80 family cysteine peptidase [Candidatus Fukatsuia symbiotica]
MPDTHATDTVTPAADTAVANDTTVHYRGQEATAIAGFMASKDYPRFQQQYQQAIDSIVAFYNQHESDEEKKRTVADNFNKLKIKISENSDQHSDNTWHHYFQAKDCLERIVQYLTTESLITEGGAPLNVKLEAIHDLAPHVIVCPEGTKTHILHATMQLESYYNSLPHKVEQIRQTLIHAAITEFISTNSGPNTQLGERAWVQQHNAYVNRLAEQFGIPTIQDQHTDPINITREDLLACQQKINSVLTLHAITYQLAKNLLDNLEDMLLNKDIDRQTNRFIDPDIIPGTLAGLEKNYGELESASLFEETEDYRYQLRSEPILLQIDIAKKLLASLPPEKLQQMGWSIETLTDDGKGVTIKRIDTLFWKEITAEEVTETLELSLSDIKGLHRALVDRIAPEQLIRILAGASEQDAEFLTRIDPRSLSSANSKEIESFFTKMGPEASVFYATKHSEWFKRLGSNPLLKVFLAWPVDQIMTTSTALFHGFNQEQISALFAKLGVKGIDYAKNNLAWFKKLPVNPLLPALLTLPKDQLFNTATDLLHGMTTPQLANFFLRLGGERGMDYVRDKKTWFKRLRYNPLILALLTLPIEKLVQVHSYFFENISYLRAKDFFSKLGPQQSLEYVKRNPGWLIDLSYGGAILNPLRLNPVIPTLLTLNGEELLQTVIPGNLKQITETELNQLFVKLGPALGIEYAKRHPAWFETLPINPLLPVLADLSDNELIKIPPEVFYPMTAEAISEFFQHRQPTSLSADYIKRYLDPFQNQQGGGDHVQINAWGQGNHPFREFLLNIVIIKKQATMFEADSFYSPLKQLLIAAIEFDDEATTRSLLLRTTETETDDENIKERLGLEQKYYGHHKNPLFLALEKNRTWLVTELLLLHPLKDYQDHGRYHVLSYPIQFKNVEILEALLLAGADANEKDALTQRPRIEEAVLSGDPRLVRVLLQHQAKDEAGNALLLAIRQGNSEMVQALSTITRPNPPSSLYDEALAAARILADPATSAVIIAVLEQHTQQLSHSHSVEPPDLFQHVVTSLESIQGERARKKQFIELSIQDNLDRLHQTSGTPQLEIAFRLKQQIHAYLSQQRDPLRHSTLLTLDSQLNRVLFTGEMSPFETEMHHILSKDPAWLAYIYQSVHNEPSSSRATLMAFFIAAIKHEHYLNLGGFPEPVPSNQQLVFNATFHSSLENMNSEELDHFISQLRQDQQSGELQKIKVDRSKKQLHIGYSYDELVFLAEKYEIIRSIKRKWFSYYDSYSGVDSDADYKYLQDHGNPTYIHQRQREQLTQIKESYDSLYSADLNTWDSHYTGQGRLQLNQQLAQQADINGQLRLLLDQRQGLLLGRADDWRRNSGIPEFIIHHLDTLKQQGVSTLFLDLPNTKLVLSLIDDYQRTKRMSPILRKILRNNGTETLFSAASEKGMTIIPMGKKIARYSIHEYAVANNVAMQTLTGLPTGEKFIFYASETYLRPLPGAGRFLPSIAHRLNLPVLEINANQGLSVKEEPFRNRKVFSNPSAFYKYDIGAYLNSNELSLGVGHAAERDNAADWIRPMVDRQQAAAEEVRKSRVIIQLEEDRVTRRAVEELAGKHPDETVIYQRDQQGNLHLVYGKPVDLQGDLNLVLVGHGRGGGDDAHNNTTLAGYNAAELAGVTQQVYDTLSDKHVVHGPMDKLILAGCALVNDDQTGGFLFDMAPELLKPGAPRPRELVGYSAEIGISGASSETGRGHRHQVDQGVAGEPARHVRVSLQRDETGTRYLQPASQIPPRESPESTLPPVVEAVQERQAITSSDKSLMKRVDWAKERLDLSRLSREVKAEILRLGGTEFRLKGFGPTVDGKTELIFVPKVNAEQRGRPGQDSTAVEKRLTSESDVFVRMQNKMGQLEPEIAHVDGVSTMNAAFLAMNLLSHRGEQEESPWKKFVGRANLTQILHGLGQDMGHLVSTVNTLSGAGAKAEGMLGRLLGGVRFTHAGSVVNVAVDIINLVDAVKDLQQIPEGSQKDFAVTRVALAGTQLTVDGTLAVLGMAAGFSPAVASGMAIAGPLSVPFAGVMIGINALVQALSSNNAHYQVEVSEIIAPFCHAASQTLLQPTAIAQHDPRHPGVIYFEPYVPIQKMVINGNRLSVQVADITVPEFKNNGSRERTGRELSAYPAFGIDPATVYQQSIALPESALLVLPATLAGHYGFMSDTGAAGRFQGAEIFNRLHQHYGAAFPLSTGWSAPNDATFIAQSTTCVIALDSGTRSFTFQQGQAVKKIAGDDHLGLRAGHLPTPIMDAQHAELLTYEFQGAGGTTFIDLADDARHITIKASSEEQKRHSERWVLDITPELSTMTPEAGRARVQSQISQLRVSKTAQGAVLTLKGRPVNIMGPIPGEITLQLRPIELPGVTCKLSLLAADAQDSPTFQLSLAADSIEALSGDNLNNIQQIMQRYFSDNTRFTLTPQVRVTIALTEGDVASGLLDLTTRRWQVIENDSSAAAHPHLYRSDGTAVALLGRPDAHITSVAHIEYDAEQQQFYAVGIAHPRDNPKTSVSYRYYPHLPENQRYQRIEATYIDEKNGKGEQPLTQLIEEIHSQSSQAVIRVNAPLESLSVEYAWDGQPFYKKIEWEQNNHHFMAERNDSVSKSTLTVIALPSPTPELFAVSRLGPDFLAKCKNELSSITLLLQDDTRKVDLLGLPVIPLNVFAHVETKIVGAQPDTTFFLHSETLPGITFKLTASLPVVATGEICKWKMSLYAETRAALQGESRAKIVHLLQHKKNGSWLWDVGTSVPYSIGNNPDGAAEGVFELTPWLSSETSAATVSEIPADSAGMREAMSAFDGGNEPLGARDEVLLPSQRPDWVTARAR